MRVAWCLWVAMAWICCGELGDASAAEASPLEPESNRSPVDLAIFSHGKWLVTANETSDSVSLVRVADGHVLCETPCGDHPSAVAISGDRWVLVSGSYSGDVTLLAVVKDRLEEVARIQVGYEPHGIAVSPDGSQAFVALAAGAQVAQIDLAQQKVTRRIPVKRWPRYLALTPDGKRLAVGCSGDERVVVVDTLSGKTLYERRLIASVNMGHMQCSADGKHVYFPWMVYRQFPISRLNITQGWVLASRIARVDMTESKPYEKFSLDPRGQAIADPHGMALSPDGSRLVATAAGTHELLLYRLAALPFRDFGATTDHIDRRLLQDKDAFDRVPLGGRPMAVRFAADGKTVYVANYLRNSVQVVDTVAKEVVHEFSLGGPAEPSLARRGAAIFYDGERSLSQWYSCHSCHYNGGTNSRAMDTLNDGSQFTAKTVLPLYDLDKTGPWTWHGWQTDLDSAMQKSLTVTMQGREPQGDDTEALLEFIKTLQRPPNPYRQDESTQAAIARGEKVFASGKAGCSQCHNGPYFTDGKVHDVGLGSEKDQYDGYNTPSLTGAHRKVRWLHHGRAKTLEAVLTKYHAPQDVTGAGELTAEELADLIAYLRSL